MLIEEQGFRSKCRLVFGKGRKDGLDPPPQSERVWQTTMNLSGQIELSFFQDPIHDTHKERSHLH